MRQIIILLYQIKLLKRLIPSILKLFIKIRGNYKTVIVHKNFQLHLNLKNPIDREIYLKDKYETEQIHYLERLIIKDNLNIFIDIGSHMGFYSMNLQSKVNEVYSFEPIKENYDQLIDNIYLNNFKKIKAFNIALSNIKEEAEMWVPDINKTGGYSVYDKNDEELKRYNIKSISKRNILKEIGDEILKFENKNIAIKIDVERHEKKVLEGIVKLINSNKVLIQIEIFEKRKADIFSFLIKNNFKNIHNIQKDHFFKNY